MICPQLRRQSRGPASGARRATRWLAAPAACVLLGAQPVPVHTAGEQVAAFLAASRAAQVDGLPDEVQFARIAPYLSPTLSALVVRAQEARRNHVNAHPGDKPPLADGDLFSSLFEGPTGFEIAASDERGQHARVKVKFRYADARPGFPGVAWQDEFLLTRTGPGADWRIDDVEYQGQWDFANKGRLSDVLRAAASPAP